ncbi:transposase [Cohnella boryungensis]|uniref:Transposase n=1 Tax=Cohnella boryungensis TaxID=768479 RepID=A0ABV8SC71_9BACL
MATTRRRFTPNQKALIVSRLLEEQSRLSELAKEHRISPVVLNRWKNHATRNLHKLFENERRLENRLKNAYEQQISELREETDKLRQQLDWLKQTTIAKLSKEDRNEFVSKAESGVPIRTQTALLGLSRSTLYYRMNHPTARKPQTEERVDIGEAHSLPLSLFSGVSLEPARLNREKEWSKLKMMHGLMDVFGGYH